MAEYLEREGLLRELRLWNLHKAEPDNFHYTELKAWLEALPAEDVQPVTHGEWINTMPNVEYKSFCQVKCSICESIEAYGNFCRNCGADMRGE